MEDEHSFYGIGLIEGRRLKLNKDRIHPVYSVRSRDDWAQYRQGVIDGTIQVNRAFGGSHARSGLYEMGLADAGELVREAASPILLSIRIMSLMVAANMLIYRLMKEQYHQGLAGAKAEWDRVERFINSHDAERRARWKLIGVIAASLR